VPVIVSVYERGFVFFHVVTVSVEVEAAGFGLNDAMPWAGSPLTLSETFPLKPPTGAIVTV
jgi:hypothetical protein